MSDTERLRVGIVGGNARRGWAHDAHVPALRRLAGDFELAAVSARSQAAAEEARSAFGAGRAFGDSLALVQDPDIDLVVVAVKVPEHRAVVLAALDAGKHVYCEWPLGRDAAEAEEMAAAVQPASHVMIGLQALSAPAVRTAAAMVRAGAIGRPKRMRVVSATAGWGSEAPPHYAYLQDRRNGATLETIAGGHTLAAIEEIAGAYTEIDARSSVLRSRIRVQGTEQIVERTCADHMMVLGRHAGGCVSTLEVVGGAPDTPFLFELDGEDGWIRMSSHHPGGFQVGVLTLASGPSDTECQEPAVRDLTGPPANLVEAYTRLAADIRTQRHTVPDFGRAVRLTHLLDRIEAASTSGRRQHDGSAGAG